MGWQWCSAIRISYLEIALSDTTILMVYSLIEGFFFEEFNFYCKGKKSDNLKNRIELLLVNLNIHDKELSYCINYICNLRRPRNAITHRNGALKDSEIKEISENFKGGILTVTGYPIATVSCLREIVSTGKRLISMYSKLAMDAASNA